MTRPGFITWTGLAVVLIAAAALSFNSLRLLAIACHISPTLAPGLPICVDAGAAVATRAWLSGRTGPVAEQYARRTTWALLGLTVTGNATHQLMATEGVPAWLLVVTVIVGAVPAGVMGAAVHLAVLLGRDEGNGSMSLTKSQGVDTSPVEPIGHAPSPVVAAVETPPAPSRPKPKTLPEPTDRTSAETLARALLADNPTMGRRALMRQTGLREYDARKMLEQARAEAQPQVTPSRGDDAATTPRNGHRVLEDAK